MALNGRIASVLGIPVDRDCGHANQAITATIAMRAATPIVSPRRRTAGTGEGATGPCVIVVETAATNRKPRPGTVTMYLYSPGRSPSARLMAAML